MNLIQAFTTENVIMLKIISIPILIIEWFLFLKTTSLILKIETSKKKSLIFIIANSLIGSLLYLIPNNLVVDLLNIVQFILSFHIIFKVKIKNCFIALVFSYMGAAISGYLAQILLIKLFSISLIQITVIPLYYGISCTLSSIIWFIFIVLFNMIKNNKKINIFKLDLKYFVILNLLFGIITIALISYLFSAHRNSIPFELTLVVIITLIIYYIVSMYSLVRTASLEKTREDLENEIAYNKTLSLMHDNIRSFKHDFNNIVQVLGGYIGLNDMDGLKAYYSRLLDECRLTNNLNLLNPETINCPSIYSLLTNKYYTAQQKNINMNFSIFTDLSKLNTNMYDLTRILGILLDNAIEAAEETEEKIVDIEITSDNKKQLFIVKNSCKDSNISTTKIFEKGYSTKERNSGIGLWKVHKILSKNPNLNLYTTVNDNIFSQQLEVYY